MITAGLLVGAFKKECDDCYDGDSAILACLFWPVSAIVLIGMSARHITNNAIESREKKNKNLLRVEQEKSNSLEEQIQMLEAEMHLRN